MLRLGHRDVVVAGERAHHAGRCVLRRGKAARQFGQGLGLDLFDQVADDVVKQRDMGIVEARGAVEEQAGDAPQRLGALLGGAMLDDIFQFGEQRGRSTHGKNLQKND